MKAVMPYEDPVPVFVQGITNAVKPEQLAWHLDAFKWLFYDAWSTGPRTEEEFKNFRTGLEKERRKIWAGPQFQTRFGAVVMPHLAVEVGRIAHQFNVPWGLAFNQLLDKGYIIWAQDHYEPKGGFR